MNQLTFKFKPGTKTNLGDYHFKGSPIYYAIYFGTNDPYAYLFLYDYTLPQRARSFASYKFNNIECLSISLDDQETPTYIFMPRNVGGKDAYVLVKDENRYYENSDILLTFPANEIQSKIWDIEISNDTSGCFLNYPAKNNPELMPIIVQGSDTPLSPPMKTPIMELLNGYNRGSGKKYMKKMKEEKTKIEQMLTPLKFEYEKAVQSGILPTELSISIPSISPITKSVSEARHSISKNKNKSSDNDDDNSSIRF